MPAVPFRPSSVARGLPNRQFGVELEFDIDPDIDRFAALDSIGRALHARGLLRRSVQRRYHGRQNARRAWRFERDASVHGEIISPVLADEPRAWAELAAVCEVVRANGGVATRRTGGHVHVSVGDFSCRLERHARLLALFGAFEDALYRLAQNPAGQSHRGIRSCAPNAPLSPADRSPLGLALYHSNHRVAVNFTQVTTRRPEDHVEFRLWDSTLDPGVIQTHVKLSVGLVDAARRDHELPLEPEPLGTHAAADLAPDRESLSFRRLMDLLFDADVDKEQAAALFAVTTWQEPARGGPGRNGPRK